MPFLYFIFEDFVWHGIDLMAIVKSLYQLAIGIWDQRGFHRWEGEAA
jgi:hypothetical protein